MRNSSNFLPPYKNSAKQVPYEERRMHVQSIAAHYTTADKEINRNTQYQLSSARRRTLSRWYADARVFETRDGITIIEMAIRNSEWVIVYRARKWQA